jgi:hypothetical protein
MSEVNESARYEQLNRPEHVRWAIERAIDIHLLLTHNARVKLVATRLPKANIIVDLGAAAGSIYATGYPHRFEKLIPVDLPPECRADMYRSIEMPNVRHLAVSCRRF